MRVLRRFFLVSAGQWLRHLVIFRTLPSPCTRNGKFATIESQLEALELSYLLTMLKNDSMNLNFRYMISYNCCCHHHMNANELW
jgi:hypothetical protein